MNQDELLSIIIERDKIRTKAWLDIIKMSQLEYDLYVKYPTSLALIRELQEIIQDRDNITKELEQKLNAQKEWYKDLYWRIP